VFLLNHVSAAEYMARCDQFDAVVKAMDLSPFDRHLAWVEHTRDEHCFEWPVPPAQFFVDPYYLGEQIKVRPMIGDFLADYFDPFNIYELFLFIAGIGSGKSFSASLAIIRSIYELSCLREPQRYLNGHPGVSLSGDAPIVLMNASAAGAKQAGKIVFGEAFTTIMESPYFNFDFPPYEGKSSELEFEHRISLSPGTSRWESALGFNIWFFVVDEAAFGVESERADYVKELFQALNQRRRSRFGRLGGGGLFTSPGSEYGFVEAMALEGGDWWDTSVMVRRTTTWEAKDELKPGAHIFLLDRDPDVVRIIDRELTFQGWAEGGTVGVATRANGEVVRWKVKPIVSGEVRESREAVAGEVALAEPFEP